MVKNQVRLVMSLQSYGGSSRALRSGTRPRGSVKMLVRNVVKTFNEVLVRNVVMTFNDEVVLHTFVLRSKRTCLRWVEPTRLVRVTLTLHCGSVAMTCGHRVLPTLLCQ